MIADCNLYVLSQEYPPAIVDIDTYMDALAGADYNQNEVAAEQAVSSRECANAYARSRVTALTCASPGVRPRIRRGDDTLRAVAAPGRRID